MKLGLFLLELIQNHESLGEKLEKIQKKSKEFQKNQEEQKQKEEEQKKVARCTARAVLPVAVGPVITKNTSL